MERYKMYVPIKPINVVQEDIELDELELSVWHEGTYGVAVKVMPCQRTTIGVRHVIANDKVNNIMFSACPMRKDNTKKLERVWKVVQRLAPRIAKMYNEGDYEKIITFAKLNTYKIR